MRALVVDDSSAMRAVLRMILKKQNFEVVDAKDGLDALQVLQNIEPVDLILIDWNMPAMNGFELLQHIRGEARYGPTKVVMVTTETALAEMSNALAAGADEYIMKPFTPDVVADKLRLVGL
jgi:two-component system chemotaxis response regulator CheY